MAIESIGYPGQITPGPLWGQMQQGLGRRYWVKSPSDCKVTPRSNGTRQVNIAAGWIGGCGIVDHNTSTATVTLPTVSSGTRWFAVYARRNWNSGSVGTTFVADSTPLTATDTLPDRNTDGDGSDGGSGIDDQPLALVPLTAGATVPGTPIDLRVFSSGEAGLMVASSELVLQYMNNVGDMIRIGNTTWSRLINASGAPIWEQDPEIVRSGPNYGNPLKINGAAGWTTVSQLESRGIRTGNDMKILFQARRTGATLSFPIGSAADDPILTVGNTAWRPPYTVPFAFQYVAASGATYGGFAKYTTAGEVQLISVTYDTTIGKSPINGVDRTSFLGVASWTREPSA
jgi:hypothetical protein